MDEIWRIAERITVMRDGRAVMTCNAGETSPEELVRNMTGHDLPERKSVGRCGAGSVALRAQNLRAGERVRDVSFEVKHGEILGIAGLVGSGRTETLRAIFGADAKDGGEIFIGDKRVIIRKPSDALRAGIGLVPEDRKRDGLLLPQSIRVNTTLNTLSRHVRYGNWLDTEAETKTADAFRQRLKVACVSIEQAVGELSGGNQQKVVIARWLARDCEILMFDEPTRGIDVAAKDAICRLLRDLAAESKAIVVVSSELVELMALCDRIIVLSQGRITGEFTPDTWTQEKITWAAFGGYLDSKTGAANS
jgi:ribose transport system ATP-binding protein